MVLLKKEAKVKQKNIEKATLSIPMSENSTDAIKKHLVEKEQDDCIFKGQKGHFINKPICSQQYARIVKRWIKKLYVENVSQYSTISLRKTKPSVIYA